MKRRLPLIILLVLLLLAVFIQRTLPRNSPAITATTPFIPTLAPTEAGPLKVSGSFEVSNTSAGIPEVLVESMEMIFDYQQEPSGAWQRLTADCIFEPAVPVLIRDTQAVHYDCAITQVFPPDAELRARVEIRLMGSSELFQIEVQQ